MQYEHKTGGGLFPAVEVQNVPVGQIEGFPFGLWQGHMPKHRCEHGVQVRVSQPKFGPIIGDLVYRHCAVMWLGLLGREGRPLSELPFPSGGNDGV